jgi:hypothetical protein
MDDTSVLTRIEALIAEEHALQRQEGEDAHDVGALDRDRGRLADVNVELDRCWDLLRQRRARRSAGEDPDAAQARPADTVEHYLQ